MGLAMLPTFLKVFLLAERRRGLEKRRATALRLMGTWLFGRANPKANPPAARQSVRAPKRRRRRPLRAYGAGGRHPRTTVLRSLPRSYYRP
jgi:hypothetical protein